MPARYDDDDDRPRKKARRRDDDDDDDDDDRPRKKKAKKKAGLPMGLIGGGAVLLLLVAAGGGYLLLGAKRTATAPGGVLGPAVPAGYAVVDDDDNGFTCLLPGTVRRGIRMRDNNPNILAQSGTNWAFWEGSLPDHDSKAHTAVYASKTKTYGTTEAELLAGLREVTWSPIHANDIILDQKPVTVSGRPGLDIRFRQAKFSETLAQRDPNAAKFFEQAEARGPSREPLYHSAVRVVADGKRLFLIEIRAHDAEPDPQVVKTVFDSLAIR